MQQQQQIFIAGVGRVKVNVTRYHVIWTPRRKKINNTRLQKCMGFEANDEDGKGSGGGTVDPAASEPNAVSKYRNMTILSIIYDPLRTFTTLFPYMVKYVLIVLYRQRRQTRFFRTIFIHVS